MPLQINLASPYAILTYPRSGSHYLQNLLVARFGIAANSYHNLDEIENQDKVIISVVRNPLDAMASELATAVSLVTDVDLLSILTSNPAGEHSDPLSDRFISIMNDISNHADIIIDYDDLCNSTESVVRNISSALGIASFNNSQDISVEPEPAPSTYIPSSKTVAEYNTIYEIMSNQDLSLATAAYQQVLAKAL